MNKGNVALWIVVGLAAFIGFGYYIALWEGGPGLLIGRIGARNERIVNTTSQQYQATTERSIRDQIIQYNTNAVQLATLQQDPIGNKDLISALTIAQSGIVRFVHEQSKNIPREDLPQDIRDFLDTH